MIYNPMLITRDLETEIIKFDNPKVIKFKNNPKYWSSMTYMKISQSLSDERKNILSHFLVLSLIQDKNTKISRIYRCFDIVLHVFATYPSEYENYFRQFFNALANSKTRNLREDVFLLVILKSLAVESDERMNQIEQRIALKFNSLLKKVFLGIDKKKILKYLAILVDLQNIGWNFTNEKKVLVLASLKCLEIKKNSAGKLLKYPQDYYKACSTNIIHLVSLLTHDEITGNMVSSVFQQLNSEFYSQSSSISLCKQVYHHIPKNPWNSFTIQVDQLKLTSTYKEEVFPELIITHHTAVYQNYLDLSVKIFHLKNQNIRTSVLHYLKLMTDRSKLASSKNFIQNLLGYFELNQKIFVFLEPFHASLIDLISKSKKELPEKYLKKVTKRLICSFVKLEKHSLFHGNFKPHHILCNEKWNLRISGFPDDINIDIEKSFKNRTDLIQGCSGYNAPDIPDVYDHQGKYFKKRADVFALGMVLLQLATRQKLDGINKNKDRRDALVLNIKFKWLRDILNKMLASSYDNRPLFKDLLIFFKKLNAE